MAELLAGGTFSQVLLVANHRDEAYMPHVRAVMKRHGIPANHLLMTHDPGAPPLVIDPAVESHYWQASLHEGFADFIAGDVYFKTRYEGQNLHRARVQLKLTESIETRENLIRKVLENA